MTDTPPLTPPRCPRSHRTGRGAVCRGAGHLFLLRFELLRLSLPDGLHVEVERPPPGLVTAAGQAGVKPFVGRVMGHKPLRTRGRPALGCRASGPPPLPEASPSASPSSPLPPAPPPAFPLPAFRRQRPPLLLPQRPLQVLRGNAPPLPRACFPEPRGQARTRRRFNKSSLLPCTGGQQGDTSATHCRWLAVGGLLWWMYQSGKE